MEANVRKELDTFKLMLLNWRADYLSWADEGDNEWIIEELQEEISTFMMPQVRRFQEMKYITSVERNEFNMEIIDSVNEFIRDIKEGHWKKKKVRIDIEKFLNQFNIHKDLVMNSNSDFHFIQEQKQKIADIALLLIPALVEKCNGCKEGGCGGC